LLAFKRQLELRRYGGQREIIDRDRDHVLADDDPGLADQRMAMPELAVDIAAAAAARAAGDDDGGFR
jgi:hypothetical protein